ncbi:unnamed protein product [Gadus morhua 'NCC']
MPAVVNHVDKVPAGGSRALRPRLYEGLSTVHCKPKALERDVTEMDPALRLMLQEKERAVRTLQETVEG